VNRALIFLLPTVVALGFLFVPRNPHRASPLVRLRAMWLLVIAVLVTLIGDRLADHWQDHQAQVNRVQGVLVVIVTAAFAWLNRSQRPVVRYSVIAVALGGAMNAAVTLVYGGMPVSRAAGLDAGIPSTDLRGPRPTYGYVLSEGKSWFAHYVGDFIPVPHERMVFSIGDILIWGGLAVLLAAVFRSVAPVRGAREKAQN
jgi:hypothetical protein